MAWLGETIEDDRPMTELIEEALYRHRQSLFGELSVAFFDTTSLYFEGKGGATLGRRGFSKDFRPQLHQVVLGIVLDGHDARSPRSSGPATPPTSPRCCPSSSVCGRGSASVEPASSPIAA
jgi:hypothetical protein